MVQKKCVRQEWPLTVPIPLGPTRYVELTELGMEGEEDPLHHTEQPDPLRNMMESVGKLS